MKQKEETVNEKVYSELSDYEQLLIDTMKKTSDMKEVKKLSKKIDHLKDTMELLK